MNRDFVEMLSALSAAGAEYLIVGAYAKTIIAAATGPVLAIVVLVVLAAAGWFVLRRRRAAAHQRDAYECWADCSCPACVAIVAGDTLARLATPDA